MPNLFAQFVLYAYPLVVIVLFRRLPVPQALVWSIMGGYLFLPERTGIDFPLLPELNKILIPSLSAAIMCYLAPNPPLRQPAATDRAPQTNGRSARSATATDRPRRPSMAANLCLVVLFVTPVGVALTNTDWVFFGPRVIPGIRLYDVFAMILHTGVMLLPFLLARRHLGTDEAHMSLLWAFVTAGLFYSLLILVEVRLSPQLHNWIYGFHSHDFLQHVRRGGYRPMVFIQHGLRVGIFMSMVVLAAFTLYKIRAASKPQTGRIPQKNTAETTDKGMPIYVGLYLLAILFIAKAVGAFLIALIFLPVLLLTKPKHWRFVAAAGALLVLLYPMARSAGLIPVDRMYEAAAAISEERAASFGFRLENEDLLLDRVAQKPLFGWGGWGRSVVYDANTGRDISVADGMWVIVFGLSGWVGYLAQFGLLTLPVFAYFFTKSPLRHSIAGQGLCLILTANLIDLLPNSGLTPVTWMVAGALLGRFERREFKSETQTRKSAVMPSRKEHLAVATRPQASRRSMR